MDMNTPLLLFLSVICANILRAQTIEPDGAKPCQGGSAAQAAGATANAGPCQKPAEPVEAVVARPAPKPGAIHADIALRDGSVLRCAIPARSLPFTTAFGQKVDIRLGAIDKIVAGKLDKFYSQVCLVEQAFVKDQDKTVAAVLAEAGKAAGDEFTIRRFVRWQLGA